MCSVIHCSGMGGNTTCLARVIELLTLMSAELPMVSSYSECIGSGLLDCLRVFEDAKQASTN